MEVEGRMQELVQKLNKLPEITEPPPTTLQILGQQHKEQDWQRFLFYFISPDESHGFGYDLLAHLLSSLSERNDLDYKFSRLDLQDIRVATEVVSDNNTRPDAILWLPDDWFICWELKLLGSETDNQTEAYIDAASFSAIDLDKHTVREENHHYIYLAPENASSPQANEFVQLSWEWIGSELEAFLSQSHGEYPARSTAQLDDFISTIQQELTMTEHQANQQAKTRLYFEYYDEIQDVQQAFDNQWDMYGETWGVKLAQMLDSADVVEIPGLSENHVAIELDTAGEEPTRWIFRQGGWDGIAKAQWRRSMDDLSVVHSPDDDTYATIDFCHRLDHNQTQAVRDNIVDLTLWHGTNSDSEFQEMVNQHIRDKIADSESSLPPTMELTGRTGSVLTLTYNIPVAHHTDFFDAYTAALREAFRDLTVEYTDLVAIIDAAFDESLEAYYGGA